MFSSLLVANRAEIACRIFRTARAMGIKCIAVYSDADAKAKHVREADEAFHIGASPAADSYLNSARILDAAKKSGAEAIHPGYGFLSENPEFAEAVIKAGLIWVGPTPASIRAMGLKDEAKRIAEEAGAPVVPGYRGADQSEAVLLEAAREIGFPVLIKAIAGGGGRGIREAKGADDFSGALAAAKREAKAAFGDDRVIVEKLIAKPRHIEVQVFGDKHGNLVHLFERDCSLQRRRQKVIEEAPAPGMTEDVRAVMTEAALKIARAVTYENAGTVEFIVEGAPRADNFYFMEMNTRLQVEHPVTEKITGVDLVAWQLRVAAGEKLPKTQNKIKMKGYAIEARLCAEDPAHEFRPSVGRLSQFEFIRPGHYERLDGGYEAGDEVSPFYDSLLAKYIHYDASDRLDAVFQLNGLLGVGQVAGVETNVRLLKRCLTHKSFWNAEIDTGWIGEHLDELSAPNAALEEAVTVCAALAATAPPEFPGPFDETDGWRMNAPPRVGVRLYRSDRQLDVSVVRRGRHALVRLGDREFSVEESEPRREGSWIRILNETYSPTMVRQFGSEIIVHLEGEAFVFQRYPTFDAASVASSDSILAPLPGKLVSLTAKPGAKVKRGDVLALLEAMKMEHALTAPRDGVVEEVAVRAGAQVKQRDLIVRLKAEP